MIPLSINIFELDKKNGRKWDKYKNSQKPAIKESDNHGCFIVNYTAY